MQHPANVPDEALQLLRKTSAHVIAFLSYQLPIIRSSQRFYLSTSKLKSSFGSNVFLRIVQVSIQ